LNPYHGFEILENLEAHKCKIFENNFILFLFLFLILTLCFPGKMDPNNYCYLTK
jgi:hypothetical protein